jgi:hypothetical protein
VYIGNDGGPEGIGKIVQDYENDLDIRYRYFETNIGRENLVNQWERCISVVENETWIWLFSDDDLMQPDCVERFYKALEQTSSYYDIYRFNTIKINKHNEPFTKITNHPAVETGSDFLARKLAGKTNSFAVEYIFKKEIYEKNGGFVKFPMAWASDDATWALFGKDKGICTIPDTHVKWRFSGSNLSSLKTSDVFEQRLNAVFQFLAWIKNDVDLNVKDDILLNWAHNQLKFTGKKSIISHLQFLVKLHKYRLIRISALVRGFMKRLLNIGRLKNPK